MPEALLVAKGLSVRFGGVPALDGVDLGVDEDEVVGLVGPNGSGKSTFLNAAGGLLRGRVSGFVSVLGQRNGARAPTLARAGLARSFQAPRLLEHVTIVDNVLCGAHRALRLTPADLTRPKLVGERKEAVYERALALLDLAGLAGHAHEPIRAMPFGTRKLVDIIRALVSQPKLVFLDEPTSGLDAEDRTVVIELVKRVRETSRVSILLVEHHLDLVREVADRVVALSAGRVLLAGTVDEVFRSPEFADALVGGRAGERAPSEQLAAEVGG